MMSTGQPFKQAESQDKLGPHTGKWISGYLRVCWKKNHKPCVLWAESSGSKKDNEWDDNEGYQSIPTMMLGTKGQSQLLGLLQWAGSWSSLEHCSTDENSAQHRDWKSPAHCCGFQLPYAGDSTWRLDNLGPALQLKARSVIQRPREKASWSWWPRAAPDGVRSLEGHWLQGSIYRRKLLFGQWPHCP